MPHPWHLNRHGICTKQTCRLPGARLRLLLLRSQMAEPELSQLRKTLQKGMQCWELGVRSAMFTANMWSLGSIYFSSKRIRDSGEETWLETSSSLPYLLHSTQIQADSSLSSWLLVEEIGWVGKRGCMKQIDSLFMLAEDYGSSIWQCQSQ